MRDFFSTHRFVVEYPPRHDGEVLHTRWRTEDRALHDATTQVHLSHGALTFDRHDQRDGSVRFVLRPVFTTAVLMEEG